MWWIASLIWWRCPQQCVDEATVEGLILTGHKGSQEKPRVALSMSKTVLHRRTRLLNCYLMCLRLTALVFCINKLGRSRCFPHEHGRNCEKLALSTPSQAGTASGSGGIDCILGSKMYHRIHRLRQRWRICCHGKVPASPLSPVFVHPEDHLSIMLQVPLNGCAATVWDISVWGCTTPAGVHWLQPTVHSKPV